MHKFGGAALASGADVRRGCRLVASFSPERTVLVVSAHLGVTRLLGEVAREAAAGRPALERVRVRHRGLLRELGLDPEHVDRWLRELEAVLDGIARRGALGKGELDHVLSFGERLSARIVAAALRAEGIEATPLDAFDLGFTSDGSFGRARPSAGVGASLARSLAEVPGVPVVTGFLAKDGAGRLTTLGRNGSDLTAAIVAEALAADELVLWKGVPGVLSADPGLVPEAHTLEQLSFADALELAHAGADVLHPEALEPVRRAGIAVRVLDVRRPDQPGTRLAGGAPSSEPLALAGRAGLARIAFEGEEAQLAGLCALLGEREIEARLLAARPGRLECWLDAEDLDRIQGDPGLGKARVERDLALVHLVGGSDPASARRVLECLAQARIGTLRVLAGELERGQVVGVAASDFVAALRCLHGALLARA